jgi:hypothetical protein
MIGLSKTVQFSSVSCKILYRWVAINFCFTSLTYVAVWVHSSYEYDPKLTAAKIIIHLVLKFSPLPQWIFVFVIGSIKSFSILLFCFLFLFFILLFSFLFLYYFLFCFLLLFFNSLFSIFVSILFFIFLFVFIFILLF